MSVFSKSLRHIKRSPYQAFAAILIMMFTFVIAGIFFLAVYGSHLALSYFESKPQLIIFFSDDKPKDEINMLEQKLIQTGNVADTTYVSKEDALDLYRQWYKDDPLLLEMVTADILPQSLEVSASDARFLEDLANMVKNEPGVEDVEYQADVVKQLVSWTTTLRIIGIGLVSFLVLESLLVMVTVVGMKIALRREEIALLQLIGATKWYIGKPFLVEGALYGLIGSLTGWLVAVGGVFATSSVLKTLFSGAPINLLDPIFITIFLIIMVFSGVILGILGSLIAVLRYLR